MPAPKKSTVEKKMRKLADEIRKHQRLYYIENNPVITDLEFDTLLNELLKLEEEYPDLAQPDSPTQIVGSDLESTFVKVEHTIPVLSLSNTYSPAEALDWANKTATDRNLLFSVQWKVDGATLVLYYKNGQLDRAVTRGSGQIGDDVSANARTIKNIPMQLNEKVNVAVRGEAYMTFEDFKRFNEIYENVYANPRNLTAGSLKHKKSKETAKRPIRYVAFEGHFEGEDIFTEKLSLDRLKALGLPVFPDTAFAHRDNLEEVIGQFTDRRESVGFPVDGLVIKVDDMSLRKDLGFTAHSPRWAVSLKFNPEIAETRIENIEIFVGRTGRATPRAKLTPVKLAGTTVSYATLHNADYIKRLGVRVGSMVRVSKRGDIIPAVEEVVDPGSEEEFRFPVRCPACNSKLIRNEDAADWMCPNEECPDRLINTLIFFCQRKQMDIAGMGEKIVRILFEKGFILHIWDIYNLQEHADSIRDLEGFGEKSVKLMLEGIEKSRSQPFRRVLYSMGLRELGPAVSEILINEGYNSIEKIKELALSPDAMNSLSELEGVGPRTAEAIIEHFHNPIVLKSIEHLKNAGLQMEEVPEKMDTDLPKIFEGEIWCVTGSFEHFKPRDLAMEEVKKRGGRVTSSVSSKTTHLLAGESGGSKLEKAKKLGIAIVEEADFLKRLHT